MKTAAKSESSQEVETLTTYVKQSAAHLRPWVSNSVSAWSLGVSQIAGESCFLCFEA